MGSQRRRRQSQLRKQRIANKKNQKPITINNEDTLNRIANIPQQVTNDPLIFQFFNGFTF
jgi:hypothetical protein